MIGKIKGKVVELEENIALVETTSGLSYQVFVTPSVTTKINLPFEVSLYTYLQVREDAMVLFGFEEKKEYNFFKLLLSVSGVGPKTAFSVISFTKVDELINAVKENNPEYFTKIPGLGKKTAMKIILELSQKLQSEFKLEKMYLSEDDKTVVDALISLGFKSADARKILSKLPKGLNLEEKIKAGLKLGMNK